MPDVKCLLIFSWLYFPRDCVSVVLRSVDCRALSISMTLSRILKGQNYSNNTQMLLAFLITIRRCYLSFSLMLLEQCKQKLLVLQQGSKQWLQTVLLVTVFLPLVKSPPVETIAGSLRNAFANEISSDINECRFLGCIRKCANIW